jgi:glycosyltransferase involved in cell wall biosynthesis
MQTKSLSVFFPMYNERRNIEQVLAQAETIIPELGFSEYEILLIDDGSQDGCDTFVTWPGRCPCCRRPTW